MARSCHRSLSTGKLTFPCHPVAFRERDFLGNLSLRFVDSRQQVAPSECLAFTATRLEFLSLKIEVAPCASSMVARLDSGMRLPLGVLSRMFCRLPISFLYSG